MKYWCFWLSLGFSRLIVTWVGRTLPLYLTNSQSTSNFSQFVENHSRSDVQTWRKHNIIKNEVMWHIYQKKYQIKCLFTCLSSVWMFFFLFSSPFSNKISKKGIAYNFCQKKNILFSGVWRIEKVSQNISVNKI